MAKNSRKNKGGQQKSPSLIPTGAANKINQSNYLNKNISKLNDTLGEKDQAIIIVSLRYVQSDYECFSEWTKDEMKLFWDFQERLSDSTWQNLKDTASKTDKRGFGLTYIPFTNFPSVAKHGGLSKDINLFELRVSEKARVHGFRFKSFFYLLWLDRNHKICN